MNYSISRNKNAIIWSFIIAAICIALFSKSSPFYPINDWVDAQCFFTVGKSMMKGMIPYKDIFEQKGPLLYFIYGIASLISFDSFLGVYFIEVAAFASFLYLSYRVISLYIETAYALCVLPAYAVAMCVTSAFSQGGSAEELCLPLFMLAIYTMLKYCREDCSTVMDSKVVIGMGFAAGLVFWIKFTLLGIFFSWMAFLFFVTWKKYDIKTGMKLCALFLSGMFLATVPWLLYFGYHNALTDLLEVYFYNNLFLYSEQVSFFNKLRFLMENIFVVAGNNKVLALLGLLGIGIVFDKNISKQEKLFLAGSILSAYLFIYLGGRILPYYPLPLFCFCVFGSVFLFKIIQKSKIALLMKRYFSVVILFVSVLSIGYGIGESCNMYLFMKNKSDMWMYKFAEEIKHEETVLNYGALDLGVYTASQKIPSNKFFCKLNINYPEMLKEQKKSVLQGESDYVVMRLELDDEIPRYIFAQYDLCKREVDIQDGRDFQFLLFKLRKH